MNGLTKFKLIGFFDGLYFLTIITSLYAVNVGIRLSDVVIAQAIYSASVFIMEIPTGLIADKFGKKVSMIAGFVSGIIGVFIFILNPNLITLIIMRFLQATGNALNSGAREALVYDICQELKMPYKKSWGSILSLGTTGFALSGIVGGVTLMLLGENAYMPLLLATNATQLIALLITTTLSDKNKQTNEVDRAIGMFTTLKESIKLFRHNATLFALAAVGFLTVANEYFLYQTYGPHLQSFNVSPFWIGLVFSAGLLLNALLQRNSYRLEKYLTLEKILLLINFALAAGYVLLGVLGNGIVLAALVVLIIGVANIEQPIVSDYANQEISSNVRATVLSGMSLISRLSKLILTFFIGVLIVGKSSAVGFLVQGSYIAIGMVIGYWLLVKCGCVRRVAHRSASI